jgi:SAM-dependent methyltransferase
VTGPAPVWDVVNGFGAFWALHAAVELGLFDALDAGPLTSSELAAAIEIGDDDDLTTLTNLLVAVDLLDTDGVSWSLPDVARRFLVTGSSASMVDLVRLSPGVHAAWPQLAATLRAGGPSAAIAAATVALYPALVEATAATQHAVAVGVAGALAWGPRPVIVDLGCGSGAWLIALLDAAGPGSTGVGVDLPHVVESVRPALADHSVTLVGGDYLDATLQIDRGDVVVLAHVLRAEPESRARALVARALDLLAPGGTLLVADYFVPGPGASAEAYRAARHDLTLALTMRAGTAGRGITEHQLAAWCSEHGAATTAVVEPVARQRVHIIHRTTGAAR